MAEQLERGGVGPLQVIDDQQHGPLRRGLSDDGDDLLEQAELGAAVGNDRRGGVVVSRLEEAAELTGEPLLPQRRGQAVEDRAERLFPGPHRRCSVAFQTRTPDDERATPARFGGDLLHQAGLAYARLAFDDAERWAAGECHLDGSPQ